MLFLSEALYFAKFIMKNECKRARLKGIMGFVVVAAAILIFHFGSQLNYGYTDEHPVLVMLLLGVLLVYGCALIGSWFRCLTDYNDKHRF